jgi:hypothetical protein
MAAGKLAGLRRANTIIWNKRSGANGTPYRSAHELIVMFVKDKLAVNNVEMGKHGRDRTNVWSYPGANQPRSSLAHRCLRAFPEVGKQTPRDSTVAFKPEPTVRKRAEPKPRPFCDKSRRVRI